MNVNDPEVRALIEEIERLKPWAPPTWRDAHRTIALDFDGVLHDDRDGYTGITPEGPPLAGARDACLDLVAKGYILVVHSCRCSDKEGMEAVAYWLKEHGFPTMPLTIGKPFAAIYVDDKAYRFTTGPWDGEDIYDITEMYMENAFTFGKYA